MSKILSEINYTGPWNIVQLFKVNSENLVNFMLGSKAETPFTHYIFPKSVCDIPVVGGVWYVCEFVAHVCDRWYVVRTCVSSLPSGVGDVHRT